jgi:hypothetical protein
MRRLRLALLACALPACALPSAAYAEMTERILTQNPFSKPSLLSRPNEVENEARSVEAEGALQLTATLVSYNMPLAIVDGELLEIGEEIRGYRLISIGEGKAIFQKNDRTYTIWLAGSGMEIEQ